MKTSPAEGEGSIYHPTYYNFSGLPKATTVFTVYDFAHERFPSLFAGDKTPVLKRKAFERADALICISESTKKDLLELYRVDSECRIRVIHLGYSDLTVLPEIPIQLPEKPYFLFVGPRHTYKNFECIVKAFALRPELKKDFCLVCFGGAPFSSKESNLLAGFGLADHVIRFSGGDEILGALYKHAAALVYPSLYEGFGMPIPEAMNCGCPVIAGNTGSIPEVAGDAALLFDPRSPEALAEALIAVAHDEQLKMKLILEGRRRCRCFSWDRCAGETLSLYRALLNH